MIFKITLGETRIPNLIDVFHAAMLDIYMLDGGTCSEVAATLKPFLRKMQTKKFGNGMDAGAVERAISAISDLIDDCTEHPDGTFQVRP